MSSRARHDGRSANRLRTVFDLLACGGLKHIRRLPSPRALALGYFAELLRKIRQGLSPIGSLAIWKDQRGTVAVMTGLLATLVIGFLALGTDVASWRAAQRSLQGVAEAAAYSAGIAYSENTGASIATQAKGIAAALGYSDGQNAVSVTVNQPPSTGAYTGNLSAIEVIIQQAQPLYFAGPFLKKGPTVTARAVATISASGSACILALDRTADQSINQQISVTGSADIESPGCDIVANSTSSNAIDMTGGATITAGCLVTSGGVHVTSGLTLTKCTQPATGATATADPFASLPAPVASGPCLSVPTGSSIVLSPGNYCSGISISGSQNVTFLAGVYYLSGNFSISGTSTANGAGVTFYLAAGNTVSITGGATTTFSAPTRGTYAGILFFGDRTATTGVNKFAGGASMTITGTIYFPTENVTFAGGSTSGSNCTHLVADTVSISGNAYVGNACSGAGTTNIAVSDGSGGTVQVVE